MTVKPLIIIGNASHRMPNFKPIADNQIEVEFRSGLFFHFEGLVLLFKGLMSYFLRCPACNCYRFYLSLSSLPHRTLLFKGKYW